VLGAGRAELGEAFPASGAAMGSDPPYPAPGSPPCSGSHQGFRRQAAGSAFWFIIFREVGGTVAKSVDENDCPGSIYNNTM